MKKYVLFIVCAFIISNSLFSSDHKTNPNTGFTEQDANIAMDAFNEAFFNKEMGLYSTTSDKKGRAAIWTQAIYWDMVMNAYKRTGDEKYRKLIEDIYVGGYGQYDGYNWDNVKEWFIYDDIMWWVISLARAYEITKDPKYLAHSMLGFERVWKGTPGVGDPGSYDPVKGGLFWDWNHKDPANPDPGMGKMACINYPTIVAAMTLYNITKDARYLDKAKEVYKWSRDNIFDKTLGRVADSKHRDGKPDWTTQLYNQATCIGSGVMLYKATKDKSYLKDAILATDYVKNTMSDKEGFLPYKNGIEQGIYAAIFAQYVVRLIEDGKQKQYTDWLRYNIDTAWKNRDVNRNLTFKDFKIPCPTGLLEVYDASGCVALMQVITPRK